MPNRTWPRPCTDRSVRQISRRDCNDCACVSPEQINRFHCLHRSTQWRAFSEKIGKLLKCPSKIDDRIRGSTLQIDDQSGQTNGQRDQRNQKDQKIKGIEKLKGFGQLISNVQQISGVLTKKPHTRSSDQRHTRRFDQEHTRNHDQKRHTSSDSLQVTHFDTRVPAGYSALRR